jgi:hypothetical protein
LTLTAKQINSIPAFQREIGISCQSGDFDNAGAISTLGGSSRYEEQDLLGGSLYGRGIDAGYN